MGADGPASLNSGLLAEIRSAKILVGGARHLAQFRSPGQEQIPIGGDLDKMFSKIRDRFATEKTVVLATGDPLYFGIGDFFRRNVAAERMVVFPQLSSIQLAFARIKESWHDAKVVSLHGRPMSHLHPALNEGVRKIAVLTDAENHPGAIARELRDLGIADATLWVLENLGTNEERMSRYSVEKLNGKKFSPLNVVIILRDGADLEKAMPALGILDAVFEKRTVREGMITKEEVRVLVLGKLALKPGMTLWDVGACTGSIAIEAKRICPSLSVWAIEKNKADIARLGRNARKALAGPLRVIAGEAPEVFDRIAELPHRIFIGGHGGRLEAILKAAHHRLVPRGRIVINAILGETSRIAEKFFHARGYAWESARVEIRRRSGAGVEQRLHPIEILYGQKKK